MTSWTRLRAESVLFEDEAALALDKPVGISVMGERHGTDLVRLAEEAGETLFPVHRIDKNTSGVILFAKELWFHGDLTRQFARRTVDKNYLAITESTGLPERGRITLPLSVGRKNRVRVAGNRADIAFDETHSRWALTEGAEFDHVRTYPSDTRFVRVAGDDRHTALALAPTTGRRHQIRVHLAWIGHPILGDPLFDKTATAEGTRTYLHSWRLAFDAAWAGGARVEVLARPGTTFFAPLSTAPSEHCLADARDRLDIDKPATPSPPERVPERVSTRRARRPGSSGSS